jgi:hypothetical protein
MLPLSSGLKDKPIKPTNKEKATRRIRFGENIFQVTILSTYKLPEVVSTFHIAAMFVAVDLQTVLNI